MRKVDPRRLESGDVCDVQVVLVMRDGTRKSGLAVGGGGGDVILVSGDVQERVPLRDIVEARRS